MKLLCFPASNHFTNPTITIFANMAKHRIVITGGGGSGKSSLIEHFISQKICAIREAAREQIRVSLEQKSSALPWEDVVAFSKNVQAQMLLDYSKYPESNFCFYDRCLLDVLAYLRMDDKDAYPGLMEDIEKHKYFPVVFILPPWKEIFRNDTERMEDFEETVRAYEVIRETYSLQGYQVVEIPKGSIEQRAQFIFVELAKWGIHV